MIGDTVIVQRAGDVIPEIVAPVVSKRDGTQTPYEMPDKCPVCDSTVIRDKAAVRCINMACPAIIKERLAHFASKDAMDIDGLGRGIIAQLVDKGLVHDIADLYELKIDDLEPLEGFAEKSAAKLVAAIDESRQTELARFIFALGIQHVGIVAARELAEKFKDLASVMSADDDALLAIDGIGPEMARSVTSFFANPQNAAELQRLINRDIAFNVDSPAPKSAVAGKKFCFTGTLPTLSRPEAKRMAEKAGAKVSGTVTKDLDFLVAGEKSGSKLAKAANLGIKVIDEQAFLSMLKEA